MKNPFRNMFKDGYSSFTSRAIAPRIRRLQMAGQNVIDSNELERMYRDTGYARKLVDLPVEDALRNWRDWNGDEDQNGLIEAVERQLNLRSIVFEAMITARLYGGAAIFIGVEGQGDVNEPLDPSSLVPGQIKYLQILSKAMFNISQIDNTVGSPNFGEPVEYKVRINPPNSMTPATRSDLSGADTGGDIVIHKSRLVILKGDTHPAALGHTTLESFWGYSSLQSINVALRTLVNGEADMSDLMSKSRTPTLKVPGMAKALALGQTTETKIADSVAAIDESATLLGTVAIDGSYEYTLNEAKFTNYDKVIEVFRTSLSGQSGIPQSKLFGPPQTGFSSGGAARKDYQDLVKGIQTNKIQGPMRLLDECIVAVSGAGETSNLDDKELFYDWSALETPTDEERSDAFLARLEALSRARALNVISEAEASEEYKKIRPDTTENS